MNLINLRTYVNQDVDDTFNDVEITRWFNKGIAQYNLIPPLTTYPLFQLTGLSTDPGAVAANVYIDEDYPLPDTFMLGIMLPYIVSSVKAQEASVTERQLAMQDFMQNARMYKGSTNVDVDYMLNKQNTDLEEFQLGENVYISDMRRSPVAGKWYQASVYTEIEDEE